MITKLKLFISWLTPARVKKSLLTIWLSDNEFWLYAKVLVEENNMLDRSRFTISDLEPTKKVIRSRFGKAPIYYLTDRTEGIHDPDLTLITLNELLSDKDKRERAVICAFDSDEKLGKAVQAIKNDSSLYYYAPARYLPASRYFHKNDLARRILKQQYDRQLGKFDLGDFENIIQALDITRLVPGAYVEIGVYRGDSAVVALEYMKGASIERTCYFFDLFEGFTNTTSKTSGDAIWVDSHTDTSLEKVRSLLAAYPSTIVEKLDIIEQELPGDLVKIAVCNIDVDLYEAVASALEKVARLIAPGGIIILEDQGHTPFLAGALAATTSFQLANRDKFVPIHLTSGQMFLVKIA